MTLEGCVVRISDLIGYLGRDIEDGIRQKLIKKEDIPKNITEVLGSTNKEIVNTLTMDIINNSIDQPYIKLSPEVYKAMEALKDFNYKNIYDLAYTNEERETIKEILNTLFTSYMHDLKTNNKESNIIKSYLKNMDSSYKENNTYARIVIDYIAGMTDDYCMKEYNKKQDSIHNKKEV